MKERAKRALRAFAWQAVGFVVVLVLLAFGIYRVETTRVLVEKERNRSPERICKDFRKVGYQCPKHDQVEHPNHKEVVAGSGNSPSGQPSPGDEPGDRGGTKPSVGGGDGGSGGSRPERKPRNPPAAIPPAPPPPPSAAAPPPEPGNSGGGSSEGQGVKKCLDLVVSACADVGLGTGR
jgi:hypothetical protein